MEHHPKCSLVKIGRKDTHDFDSSDMREHQGVGLQTRNPNIQISMVDKEETHLDHITIQFTEEEHSARDDKFGRPETLTKFIDQELSIIEHIAE